MEHAVSPTEAEITVLREMVRLSENRRTEQLESLDRVNKYNLALVAFSGSFLSLLVTVHFPKIVVIVAGIFLLLSIVLSLFAVRPRTIKGGSLTIDEDVKVFQNGGTFHLREYLLAIADLTDVAASKISAIDREKRLFTIFAALSLAAALFTTYLFTINATPS